MHWPLCFSFPFQNTQSDYPALVERRCSLSESLALSVIDGTSCRQGAMMVSHLLCWQSRCTYQGPAKHRQHKQPLGDSGNALNGFEPSFGNDIKATMTTTSAANVIHQSLSVLLSHSLDSALIFCRTRCRSHLFGSRYIQRDLSSKSCLSSL